MFDDLGRDLNNLLCGCLFGLLFLVATGSYLLWVALDRWTWTDFSHACGLTFLAVGCIVFGVWLGDRHRNGR